MNIDDIVGLAQKAGITWSPAGQGDDGIDAWYGNQYLPSGSLVKFAQLVEIAEREACALVCLSRTEMAEKYSGPEAAGCLEFVADMIRARGKNNHPS